MIITGRKVTDPSLDRRFLKTHLPVDALVFFPQIKYIYITRDGRDVVWSLHNHHSKANNIWYDALNGPGLVGPKIEPPPYDRVQYFKVIFMIIYLKLVN